jgi:hypothetical protein
MLSSIVGHVGQFLYFFIFSYDAYNSQHLLQLMHLLLFPITCCRYVAATSTLFSPRPTGTKFRAFNQYDFPATDFYF